MRRAARRDAAGGGSGESDAEMDAIGRDYPGWRPWRSRTGRYWAVRQGQDGAPPGAPAEWARTVHGDTPDELRAALAEQEGLGSARR